MSLVWTFNVRYDHGLFLQVIWAIGVSMIVLAALVHLPLRAIAALQHRRSSAGTTCSTASSRRVSARGRRCGRVLHVFGTDSARVRRVSADSVDRGHEPRLLHRRAVRARAAAARASVRVSRRCASLDRVRVAENAERVWRSIRLDAAEHDAADAVVVRERGEVSAVAAVPAAHARRRDSCCWPRSNQRAASSAKCCGRSAACRCSSTCCTSRSRISLPASSRFAMGFGTALLSDDLLVLPPQWGFGLPVVYLAWVLVVATLYPACRWFAAVKRRRSDWWLSYL